MKKLHRKVSWMGFVATVFAVVLTSCSQQQQQPQGQAKPKRIAVLQLGKHSVIDKVVSGIEDRSKEIYGPKAHVEIYNANFNFNELSILANQMVASGPDVVVGVTTPASGELIGANRGALPMVFTFVSEPKDIGYTGPGTPPNTTGLSDLVEYKKTLAMIRNVMPNAKTIGYLLTKSENNAVTIHTEFEKLAPQFGFTIKTVTINSSQDVKQAAEMLVGSVDVFLFGGDNTIASVLNNLIDTARAKRVPVFACDEESVEKGAVAAYSVPYYEMGRRTTDFCGLILSGATPAAIPYETWRGTKLVVNAKIASELGVTLPTFLVDIADRVVR